MELGFYKLLIGAYNYIYLAILAIFLLGSVYFLLQIKNGKGLEVKRLFRFLVLVFLINVLFYAYKSLAQYGSSYLSSFDDLGKAFFEVGAYKNEIFRTWENFGYSILVAFSFALFLWLVKKATRNLAVSWEDIILMTISVIAITFGLEYWDGIFYSTIVFVISFVAMFVAKIYQIKKFKEDSKTRISLAPFIVLSTCGLLIYNIIVFVSGLLGVKFT